MLHWDRKLQRLVRVSLVSGYARRQHRGCASGADFGGVCGKQLVQCLLCGVVLAKRYKDLRRDQ